MRSYEVYDIMHMIPQRRVITLGLDRRVVYGIVTIMMMLSERGMVLSPECPAVLKAVTP
jgi:hypothetical protein